MMNIDNNVKGYEVYVLQEMNDGYNIETILGVYSSYEKAKNVARLKTKTFLRFAEKGSVGISNKVGNSYYYRVKVFRIDK